MHYISLQFFFSKRAEKVESRKFLLKKEAEVASRQDFGGGADEWRAEV
jgi:hypothetical protein